MSILSKLDTTISLKPLNNESLLKIKRIEKIKKTLLNLEKEEVAFFNPLKVKIYKEEKEDHQDKFKIIAPLTFKSYFEDYKKYKEFINQVESGPVTSSNIDDSAQEEQANSSDLVDSE